MVRYMAYLNLMGFRLIKGLLFLSCCNTIQVEEESGEAGQNEEADSKPSRDGESSTSHQPEVYSYT